jgi:hypothetical protein
VFVDSSAIGLCNNHGATIAVFPSGVTNCVAAKVRRELHQQITVLVISSPNHQREASDNEHVKLKVSILKNV